MTKICNYPIWLYVLLLEWFGQKLKIHDLGFFIVVTLGRLEIWHRHILSVWRLCEVYHVKTYPSPPPTQPSITDNSAPPATMRNISSWSRCDDEHYTTSDIHQDSEYTANHWAYLCRENWKLGVLYSSKFVMFMLKWYKLILNTSARSGKMINCAQSLNNIDILIGEPL